MAVKKEKVIEVINFYLNTSEKETLKVFSITSETLHRYKRRYKECVTDFDLAINLKKIKENYTEKEIFAIAGGGRIIPGQDKVPIVDFSGKKYKFCFFTDTHMGSKFFHEDHYWAMLERAKKERVEAYYHAGDVTEGMSNRPGHIYELSHLGFEKQKDYAIKLLSEIKKPLYLISGNHDRWFIKSNGANVVKNIADNIKNAEFLGHDMGIVSIKKSNIQMWHGEDGSSYATSYRMQKVIESLTGGTKPNVLLLGHVHKMGYFFERHIHAISGGCIETQSSWMRSKRLAAHTGFWIVELTINKKGHVVTCSPTWYPFYC